MPRALLAAAAGMRRLGRHHRILHHGCGLVGRDALDRRLLALDLGFGVGPWGLGFLGPLDEKEREKLHEMTDHRQCSKPIPQLIEELNRHLKGWKNYFDFGYPRQAFREINTYVRYRLKQHLRRRSQRPFRPPEGVSFYEQIQRFGLVNL